MKTNPRERTKKQRSVLGLCYDEATFLDAMAAGMTTVAQLPTRLVSAANRRFQLVPTFGKVATRNRRESLPRTAPSHIRVALSETPCDSFPYDPVEPRRPSG